MTAIPRLLILQIEDGNAGYALRAIAEQFDIRVDWRGIGCQSALIDAVSESRHDLVLLSCHGSRGRIVLPELGPLVAQQQPFTGDLGPREIRAHLRFNNQPVLNLGCSTGNAELAQAFLDAGAAWYMAPTSDIDGAADRRFAVDAIYHLLFRRLDPNQVLALSRLPDDDSRDFELWR